MLYKGRRFYIKVKKCNNNFCAKRKIKMDKIYASVNSSGDGYG